MLTVPWGSRCRHRAGRLSTSEQDGLRAAPKCCMIVCHCEVVSDRHIRDALACGASTVDEIGDRCGDAGCGSCRPTIGTLLVAVAPEPVEPAA